MRLFFHLCHPTSSRKNVQFFFFEKAEKKTNEKFQFCLLHVLVFFFRKKYFSDLPVRESFFSSRIQAPEKKNQTYLPILSEKCQKQCATPEIKKLSAFAGKRGKMNLHRSTPFFFKKLGFKPQKVELSLETANTNVERACFST